MLRRLDVRTRLVAVIAVPLVLLLSVAVPEAVQRRDRALDADRAAGAAADVAEVSAAVDALQAERTLSAAIRAGAGPEVESTLADQRAITDDAVDRADSALLALRDLGPAVAATTRLADDRMKGLSAMRREVEAGVSQEPWVDPLAPLLDALLQVQEAVGAVTVERGMGTRLSAVALVTRVKDAASVQDAHMAMASTWSGLRGEQASTLEGARADEAAYRAAYLLAAPPGLLADRRREIVEGAATETGRTVDAVIDGAPPTDLATWLRESADRQQVLREVVAARAGDALALIDSVEASSRRSSNGYLALAGSGLLLALGLALAAARSITRPLRELTDAAVDLASERLPKLVDSLRNPGDDDDHELSDAFPLIAVGADDELGHLAQAFNTVQTVAVEVAAEQATLLRKGISDLYVNLARRNQALIDRQIHLLDQLEAEEQDTEVLEHLYLLDHLATRMRRNAESLLILADSESGPRRSRPIELVDVVRAALSEVEDYARVELGTMAAATLDGLAVSDVAHLVAELLENATQFSPPHTTVRVDGSRAAGGYQLVITDRGVGMRAEQLEELNAILREPPITGLALGRSLGCLVASRLACRHGITVRLRAGDGEGVAAFVILPGHLMVEARGDQPPLSLAAPREMEEEPPSEPPESDRGLRAPVPEPVDRSDSAAGRAESAAWLSDALPARSEFEAGIQALLDREREATLAVPPVMGREPVGAIVADEPASALGRRIPGATVEARPEPMMEHVRRRSPDEVRALLSRYRSGLNAGRVIDGPAGQEQA